MMKLHVVPPAFGLRNTGPFGLKSEMALRHLKQEFELIPTVDPRTGPKRKLPYPLLVDTNHKIAEAYGVWVQKSLFGKKYMGIERSTFVIGADGVLEHVFERVSPTKHVGILLDVLK